MYTVRFVDIIDGIVDHHCLNFLFIISNLNNCKMSNSVSFIHKDNASLARYAHPMMTSFFMFIRMFTIRTNQSMYNNFHDIYLEENVFLVRSSITF